MIFKDDFARESERWEREVRDRAAELIRKGSPPLDALELAKRQIQSERRGFSVPEVPKPLPACAPYGSEWR